MRLLRMLVALALVGFTARLARAQRGETERASPAHSPHSASLGVEPSVGFGTPLGYLGASVVVYPVNAVALHAGAGLGHQGPQVEAGLRYLVSVAKDVYFAPGLSWSTGSYAAGATDANNASSPIFYWDRAHFANATVAIELRTRSISARPFVGLGYAFGREISANRICPERGCHASFGDRTLLFVGLAVGFDIF